jgi:general secretion pathway protein I
MVALAVVAIALPALMFALSRQVDDTAYLRDKSLARMVAENKLAEKRLKVHALRELAKANESGMAEFAGRQWFWWMATEETPQPGFYRIEVDVALSEEARDNPAYTLASYMQGDFRRDNQGRGTGQSGVGQGQGSNDGEDGGAATGDAPDGGAPTPVPNLDRRVIDAPQLQQRLNDD